MELMDLFRSGGVMMWPLLLIGVGVAAITIRTALQTRSENGGDDVRRGQISVLFWGTMGLVLGLLGTVVGLIQMGSVIQLGGVEATTVWGGLTVALVTLCFGLIVFTLSLACWYTIRRVAGRPVLKVEGV